MPSWSQETWGHLVSLRLAVDELSAQVTLANLDRAERFAFDVALEAITILLLALREQEHLAQP